MPRYNINRHTSLCVRLLELRRHLNQCASCKAAIKARDITRLCDQTTIAVLDIAVRWDANIPGRLAMKRSGEQLQFLCPDTNAHGPAYAATAEAVRVEAVQDALF